MKTNEVKLMWDGKKHQPVTLVREVQGGWLVRMENGMLVGPVNLHKNFDLR